jgi:DNA-binding MarR family transcriptional regulator
MTKSSLDSPLFAEATDAWLKVVEAYNLCDKVLSARLAEVNVTVPEHEVMIVLLRHPGATQQHIAKGCFVAKSGVSMLLGRLEKQALVRRESDGEDARVKRAYLTSSGDRLARKTLKIQQELVALMAQPLKAAELATIASAMDRVANTLSLVRR